MSYKAIYTYNDKILTLGNSLDLKPITNPGAMHVRDQICVVNITNKTFTSKQLSEINKELLKLTDHDGDKSCDTSSS